MSAVVIQRHLFASMSCSWFIFFSSHKSFEKEKAKAIVSLCYFCKKKNETCVDQMSLKSTTSLPIRWSNIDVFTFGKCQIYSYDHVNHCILIDSFFDLNEIRRTHLYLSSSPSWPIRRLILNETETIVALLGDSIIYLASLPQSNKYNSGFLFFFLTTKSKWWKCLFRKSFLSDHSRSFDNIDQQFID